VAKLQHARTNFEKWSKTRGIAQKMPSLP